MKTAHIAGLSLLVFFIVGTAAAPEQSAAWQSLVAAERSFARSAAEKGIRAAFLEFLAPEAIVFRPQPVPGRPAYEMASPNSPTLLLWKPVFAEVSAAGDLGYTTGPYKVHKDKLTKVATAYGHYVTLWKKQADGAWKAVLDIGISHPVSVSGGDEVQAPAHGGYLRSKRLNGSALEKAKQSLRAEEKRFAQKSEAKGTRKAYKASISDHIRLYREGHLPAIGRQAALELLAGTDSPISWTSAAADVSLSDDLAYAYGTGLLAYTIPGHALHPLERSFSFMRIWRKVRPDIWRIVLDIVVPYPEK
jgi:ketosteroid isomerase-like protein